MPSRHGVLNLKHHLPGGVGLHALAGQSGARDVAAQLLQPLAVVGAAAHGCVQAKSIDVSTAAASKPSPWASGHRALHRQHLLAGGWAEVDTRRSLQRPERAGLVRIAFVVGHVGLAMLDEHPRRVSSFVLCASLLVF